MATYYVSKSGSDSNNGLGPDASHASNKPWLTIAKALGSSGIASGDTVYVGPGTYREVVTVAMTSATAETKVIGDYANARGFKNGSGVLLAPDFVVWTAYTTNDTTAPSSSHLINLDQRDYLTFEDFVMVNGGGNWVRAVTAAATNITFRRCQVICGHSSASMTEVYSFAGTAMNWLIEQCSFMGGPDATSIDLYLNLHTADYNIGFTITDCLFLGGSNNNIIRTTSIGSGSGKPGGVIIKNSTFLAGVYAFRGNVGSTTFPHQIRNCVFLNAFGALHASASGEVVEDYNILFANTPRTNITAGSNSFSSNTRALLFTAGIEHLQGRMPRPFLTPLPGSPALGFGNDGTYTSSVDFMNRPRPAGGASTSKAIGYVERHDTATQETTTVDASGSGIKITGPGDHDLKVPVDATSTTLGIKGRYDTNHAATNKPQVLLLANAALGISAQTLTMTAAVDTWETLTTSSFTPSAKGVVILRLVSRSAAGNGIAYFDTVV